MELDYVIDVLDIIYPVTEHVYIFHEIHVILVMLQFRHSYTNMGTIHDCSSVLVIFCFDHLYKNLLTKVIRFFVII
jgi:hypothetical protein